MKNFIIYLTVTICLLFNKANAQQTNFEDQVKLLSNKIEQITKEEKELLKKEINQVNQQLQKGELTQDQADFKKAQYANTRAKNIENRVAVVQTELKQLIQDKVDGKINDTLKCNAKHTISIDENGLKYSNKRLDSIKKMGGEPRTTSQLVIAGGFNSLITKGSIANSDFGYLRSAFGEWGVTAKSRLLKENNLLHLKYGLTFVYNVLSATDNRVFSDNGTTTDLVVYPKSVSAKRTYFKNVFMTIPVHLEFDFSKKKYDDKGNQLFKTQKGFRFGIGGFVGYNVNSKQFIYYEENGYKYNQKIKGNWNIPDFNYGLSTYVGYKNSSLYLKYDLNPMFKNNTVAQRNISLGLRLDFN